MLSLSSLAAAMPFPGQEKVRHAAVIEKASRGEAQDLLVVFDDSAAMQRAASMRAVSGVDHDTPDILREKSLLFWGKKQEVLDALTTDDAETIEDYDHLPVMFLRVKSLKGLQKLSSQPGVTGIFENQHYSLMLNQSLPLIGQPTVSAAGYTGSGTSVAVLDTGVDYTVASAFGTCTGGNTPGDCLSLPAAPASCRVACVHDFAPSDGSLDDNGHGTNVSGIVSGVAPDTKVIGLDVFNGGGASFSVIASAINWVIDNKATYNIVALNLSLGVENQKFTATCPGAFLNSVINNARSAGILAAISSGNDGFTDGISDPGCVPAAVSVGAVYDSNVGGISYGSCTDSTTRADKVTCFSNSANFLSILAPGALINAAGFTMAGTSQAAPHIAGSIALLKSAFPAETPDQTVSRMTSSGVQVLDARNNITKPRIDLVAAINLTFTISGRVVSQKGLPVEGVTMTPSGAASASTVTDANGSYLFADLSNGAYTVTPAKGNIIFTPSSRNATVSGASVNVKDFTANVYSISGKVLTASGAPVSGVTVTLGDDGSAVAVTSLTGKYIFSGLGNGTYTMTPAKAGYTFTVASKTATINGADRTGKNFTAITYAIKGRVKTPSGAPMANVLVSLTGDVTAMKVTDIFGRYRFGNLPNGSYVVTPIKTGKTFSPASINVTVTGANVTKQNFVRNP